MRLFVAVYPPPEVRQALIEAARDLPTDLFRLTAPERVHLTLEFLGEVPTEDVPRLTSALGAISRHGAPFDATTSGFGVFPSAHRARILWAGIGAGAEQLTSLAHATETLLEPEGFPREDRPFVPHLTLGRSRRPTTFDPTDALPELRFTVSGVDLVQSRQTGAGVTYETLERYELWSR